MTRAERKAAKVLEASIDKAFRFHGRNVQIPMMALGKVFKETRLAVVYGMDVNDAMQAAIAKHKVVS